MYSKGFYAGKFLPFHNGHKFCIRRAAMSCKALTVILFYNSEEELEILEGDYLCDKEILTLESRIKAIKAECANFKRAYPFAEHIVIDYPRINVPISATKIRGMSRQESKKWLE